MRASQDCKAIRINDEMCCARCGLSWAADDADRPECNEMTIPPVTATPRVAPQDLPGTAPRMQGYMARVQDITDDTPNRAITVIAFAQNASAARRAVDLLLGMPTQWRALRIEINIERVEELDCMANLGMKRVACTHVETYAALKLLDNPYSRYWRTQFVTPGLAAVQVLRSWLR